jgi:hypothetical protein
LKREPDKNRTWEIVAWSHDGQTLTPIESTLAIPTPTFTESMSGLEI